MKVKFFFILLIITKKNKLKFWTECFCKESSKENKEIDDSSFITFLKEIRIDYQNDQTLRVALDKFKEHYNAAKLKSIFQLTSFLYDLHCDLDSTIHIKSGVNIRVQVESIKRWKTEGSSSKQRLNVPTNEGKENLDPQIIPAWKKKKMGKKDYNLSKHIMKNQPNWRYVLKYLLNIFI